MARASAPGLEVAEDGGKRPSDDSARYLELLLEAARGAAFDLELRSGEIRHSPRLNALAGFAPEARPSLDDLRARCHPEDQQLIGAIIPDAAAGATYFERDVRVLRHGETRWMHVRGQVMLGTDGEPTRVVGVALDITGRKRQELNGELLHKIDQDLARLHARDEILRAVGERLAGYFPDARLTLAEVDEDRDAVSVVYDSRMQALAEEMGVQRLSEYASEAWLHPQRSGQVVAVDDLVTDPRFLGRADAYVPWGIRAKVLAPFASDGKIRFMLALQKGAPYHWRQDEIELIGELASRIYARLERARAEEALRQSEERLRRTLEVETVGVLFFNLGGRITDANNAFLRMSGYSRHELASLHWQALTPEEWMPDSEYAARELKETGQTQPYVKELVRRDSSRWWALCAPRVLPGGAGDCCVEFIIDITDARQAKEALRRSEARLRTLVENIHDYAIYGTDSDGLITDWTEGATRVMGYAAQEMIGQHISRFYPPEDVAAHLSQRELSEAAQSGRTEREAWRVRRDGRRFWANEITTPIRSADGRLLGFTVISRDLTAQKLLEEERQGQLERERKAREDAEAFLGVLSHELRTPVTSIYGTASLIARQPQRGDLVELLNDLQEEAGRLARMIDDLLVLSRVDRGLVQLAPEPILLQHAIRELLADLRRHNASATFEVDMPTMLPPVIADASALRQVLHNLLTNAVKYAGSDGPITVAARQRAGAVEVFVVDEGPGLGPDPGAVFSLFYRAPHTAQRATGTGIGLYVARGLMSAMGGTLEARTRDSGGASFRLTLPTATAD